MPYDPRQQASRLAGGWRRFAGGFTTGQKAITAIAVIGLIVAIIVFAKVASAPTYAPLFTGLKAKDASAITAKLKTAGVPYHLAAGGSTIEVPTNKVNQERLAMAGAGLPQAGAGAGLSLLDKEGITTSQFTQKADYQRAIQNELATTIDSISGIKGSKVAVVLPSQSAFALGNTQHPSASVMVDLGPSASLTRGQVSAITHLVASAIPNLSAKAVTVVDSNGNLLTGAGGAAGGAATLAAASAYDGKLSASLTSMLDQIVGPGNSQVRVAATLSSASAKTTTQGIQTVPGKTGTPLQAKTKTTKSTQTFTGNGVTPGGVLGTNPVTTTGGKSTSTKNSSSASYETGTINKTVTQPPGQVSHLAVSAVVSKLPKGVTMASLRSTVAAAAGIQTARGDTLSVVSMPFSTTTANQAKKAALAAAKAKHTAHLLSLAKTGGVILAILIALLVLWRRSRKARGRPEPALPPPPEIDPAPPTAILPAAEPDPADALAESADSVSRVLTAWLGETKGRIPVGAGHPDREGATWS
ncbi:MAG: flagellar basal-body MS-ring/collar protein FliF [Acidimicrobiales bacterium]